MTSDVYPQERCPPTQRACTDAPHDGEPELSTDKLDKVAYFLETVAVPARRAWQPEADLAVRVRRLSEVPDLRRHAQAMQG